jgi:hypothetical protein
MNFAQDGLDAQANQVAYFKWLHSVRPKLFGQVIASMERGGPLQGRGGLANQGDGLGWINELVQGIASVGTALMQKQQIDKQVNAQKKALALSDAQAAADRTVQANLALLEVNTRRAQAGLGPVDITGRPINTGALPTPLALVPYTPNGVAVGPAVTIIPGVPDTVTYVGGALLGLAALRSFKVI